jgi:hypothetical protein
MSGQRFMKSAAKLPRRVKPLPPLFRHLLLEGPKNSGTYDDRALLYIEEHLTGPEIEDIQKFWAWLTKHNLTYGHGTVDLRYHEYKHNLEPVSAKVAYERLGGENQ